MAHFLKETDFDLSALKRIFAQALVLKQNRLAPTLLEGQSWGMLFYKNSTRTRISFEVGLNELGAYPITLKPGQMQLNRGESLKDTAKILSRYLHGLIIRCHEHALLESFASEGSIPVVNALSDRLHPCQLYADLLTLAEHWATGGELIESLAGKKLAFLGDTTSNMANSWLLGGAYLGMEITLAGPSQFQPSETILKLLREEGLDGQFRFCTEPLQAVQGADVVYTDVWVSMGDESDADTRIAQMRPYSVTSELMARANPNAYFMHCLPAHPGQEVSQEVFDSPASLAFEQAENRLHIQKALLAELVAGRALSGIGSK